MQSPRSVFRAFVVSCLLLAGMPLFAQNWQVGDVFVALGKGQYAVFRNNALIQTLTTDPGKGDTAGCAFDSQFNFYAANTDAQNVVEVSTQTGSVVQTLSTTGLSPESVLFDWTGNVYAAGASPQIMKFAPNLPPDTNTGVYTYKSATGVTAASNVDWMDLAVNQTTFYFSGDSTTISRTAGSNPFATLNAQAFAVRLLPPFDGTGGLLVADTTNIYQLDQTGKIVQTYNLGGRSALNNWRFLALDPDGVSFWAGDFQSGTLARFNISSGSVMDVVDTGANNSMGGICVKGGHQLNAVPISFTAGTNAQNFAAFGPPGTSNFNTWSVRFTQATANFVLVISATLGLDGTRFNTNFPGQFGTTMVQVPYGTTGQPVVYRVENPSAAQFSTSVPAGTAPLYVYIAYSAATGAPLPPACPTAAPNPRLMRDPSDVPGHDFLYDATELVALFGKFGDPIRSVGSTLNDYVVVDRCPNIDDTGLVGTAVINSPTQKQKVKQGSALPVKVTVTDPSGNVVTDAITPPNNINLSVTGPDGTLIESLGTKSFTVFTFNGQSYAANVDTSNFPLGTNSLCVTSIDTSQVNNQVGTGSNPGQFSPACVQINVVNNLK